MQFLSRVFLAGLTVALAAGTLFRPRRGARRRSRAPKLEGDALIAGDGARLPLATWLPEASTKAVILGLHGYGDYRNAFGLAGSWFAARGIGFFAYDQRGFGETAARGTWPGEGALIADLADAVKALRAEFPDLPFAVLGESMGGAVALAGIGRGQVEGVDALVLAAPGVRGGVPMRQVHDLALRLGALALPWLMAKLKRGGKPWLDPDEATRLAEDPLILRDMSAGTYDGLVDLVCLASEPPQAPPPPTLVLYGGLDTAVPQRAIDDLMATLGERASLRTYPESHHLLLHERGTADILADCLAWLVESQAAQKRPA